MSRTYEQLEPVISALDERIKTNLGAFPTDTASGAVASFTDGADDIPLKSLVVDINPVQSGSGDPSPDNVRPISGWTGANVTRTGKNLLDIDRYGVRLPMTTNGITWTKVRDGVYHVQGTATSSSFFNISFNSPTNAMPCISFRGYRLFLSVTNPTVLVASGYFRRDGSYTQLSNGSVIPDEAVALGAYLKINPGITIDADFSVQLELGSTATAYEPYQGETYEVEFPTEAGTVYGGELTVNEDGTGRLVADRYFKSFTTLVGKSENANGYFWYTTFDTLGIPIISGLNAKLISNRLVTEPNVSQTSFDGRLSFFANGIIRWKEQGSLTLQEYKTYLANNPLEICYELAEPITYTLTPQEVSTLLGQNNIWADAGDTTVEYRANTSAYIAKKIAEAISALS